MPASAKPNILAQGAEAIILHDGNNIIKDRISKKYRHPELDKKLIKQRTKKEAKLLEKASKIIDAPNPENIKEIEHAKTPNKIIMPLITGKKLSENLEQLDWKTICKQIGSSIAKLHDNNIIHGDLTTSNMILTKEGVLYFIDFGLGFISPRIEDKAVDLHLIKQALEAKHFSIWKECWAIIEKNYNSKDGKKVLKQLQKVESRGRYKKGS